MGNAKGKMLNAKVMKEATGSNAKVCRQEGQESQGGNFDFVLSAFFGGYSSARVGDGANQLSQGSTVSHLIRNFCKRLKMNCLQYKIGLAGQGRSNRVKPIRLQKKEFPCLQEALQRGNDRLIPDISAFSRLFPGKRMVGWHGRSKNLLAAQPFRPTVQKPLNGSRVKPGQAWSSHFATCQTSPICARLSANHLS